MGNQIRSMEIKLSCVGEGTALKVASRKKDEETLAFRVQDGSRGYRTFETQAGDTVAQLTSEVAVWCKERPDNLRLLWKGTTLPGELALSNIESGTTLQVVTRQQGGAKKPKGNKSRGKKKVKMSRLSYQEKKKLLDSQDPCNAEMSFQEFKEEPFLLLM